MNPVYLVKVEPGENNNKFYRMVPGSDSFTVEYGRIGNGFQTETYPISRWDKQYASKIKKGYVDQTHLVAEILTSSVKKSHKDISDAFIADIVKRLQEMAKQAIEENYTISSNKVTQKMVDEAQAILNIMARPSGVAEFNENLVNLFRVIPRKMKRVADNLANTQTDFSRIMQNEQDLLDTMKGQVVQHSILEDTGADNQDETILDAMGLRFSRTSSEDEQVIKNNLGSISDKYYQAWTVTNIKTQSCFDKFVSSNSIKNKKLLWHGSRNENWWSIVNSGLLLRPNAVITGKMFGNGIYFAPKAGKSLGYTSMNGSYWARGNSASAFMSLYDVAYGVPYNVYSFESRLSTFDYNKLQQVLVGANCLHAHEGSMLRNDEIVVYREEQITIKYLVELR